MFTIPTFDQCQNARAYGQKQLNAFLSTANQIIPTLTAMPQSQTQLFCRHLPPQNFDWLICPVTLKPNFLPLSLSTRLSDNDSANIRLALHYLTACSSSAQCNLTYACLMTGLPRSFLSLLRDLKDTDLLEIAKTTYSSLRLASPRFFSTQFVPDSDLQTSVRTAQIQYLTSNSYCSAILQKLWLDTTHRRDFSKLLSSEKNTIRAQFETLCEATISPTCANRITAAFCNVRALPSPRGKPPHRHQVSGNQSQLHERRLLTFSLLHRAVGGSQSPAVLAESIFIVSDVLALFSDIAARQTPAQRVMTIERLLACTKRRDPLIFNA